MNQGLFNINESSDNEILKLNLFGEEAEFRTNEFAFNPKTSGDNLPTSTMNPPGGRKEDPTANEYDKGQSVDVSPPGGRGEKPSAQIYDKGQSVSIGIPQGTTLDSGTYNKALSRLQQSYKETMNMMEFVNAQMELLSNATVIPISEEEYAMNEAMDVANEAMYNHLMDGPMFEKADKADKSEIKGITKTLIPKVKSKISGKTDSKFVKPNLIIRALVDLPFRGHKALHTVWTNRLWQIIGIVYSERDNMAALLKELNEEFKDELGGYSILANKMNKGVIDLFRTKFNWKSAKCAWTLVVDNKLSSEFRVAEKEEASAAAKDGDTDDAPEADTSKDDDVKTESAETPPVAEVTEPKLEYESTGMDFDTDLNVVFENATVMKMVVGVLPASFAERTSFKSDELTKENYSDLNSATATLKESVSIQKLQKKEASDKATVTFSIKG